MRGQKAWEENFWFIGGLFKALSQTVYLQIDFEDFELNFLKKGYKSDLTNLGFSLPVVSGVTWYRWQQGALTFDPSANVIFMYFYFQYFPSSPNFDEGVKLGTVSQFGRGVKGQCPLSPPIPGDSRYLR